MWRPRDKIRKMGIRPHHLRYAARRSLYVIILAAPVFLAIKFIVGAQWWDLLAALTPMAVITMGLFTYYLMKTQRRR